MENDQSAVGGFGKRTGENDFAAFTSLVGKAQMLLAERSAAGHEVIDNFVEERVIAVFSCSTFLAMAWSIADIVGWSRLPAAVASPAVMAVRRRRIIVRTRVRLARLTSAR
jgi:hypothetical protein